MTPQELKYSILQYALQGKLTLQDINETTCLHSCKQKKTEELPFECPDNWLIAHLENISCSIPSKQYQILESDVLKTGAFPVISQSKAYSIGFTNATDRVFHHEKPVVVFGDHTTEVKLVMFDFVVGADGVKIFQPIYDVITAEYLYFVLLYHSKDLHKVGGYSRHYKYIKDKPIPLPPLAEQKRIVAKLEEILPLIDRYEVAWNKLESFNKRFPGDMQKSILQLAIQGKLVEQRSEEGTGEELFQQIQAEKQALIKAGKIKKEKPLPEITEAEIPFDIPETWKWVRLGNIIHIESGKGLTAAQMIKGDIPVYGGNGITGYHNEALLHEETVVIGRVGFYCGSVHVTEKESWVTDNAFITTYPTNSINRDFLVYMLRHMNLGQNNNATAQPVVSGKKIYPLLFPIPPLAEQKRIVAKLEEILPLCDRLK